MHLFIWWIINESWSSHTLLQLRNKVKKTNQQIKNLQIIVYATITGKFVHITSIKVCWFLVWLPHYLLNKATYRPLTLPSAEFNLVTNRPKQRKRQGPFNLHKETCVYWYSVYQRNKSTSEKGFFSVTLLMPQTSGPALSLWQSGRKTQFKERHTGIRLGQPADIGRTQGQAKDEGHMLPLPFLHPIIGSHETPSLWEIAS